MYARAVCVNMASASSLDAPHAAHPGNAAIQANQYPFVFGASCTCKRKLCCAIFFSTGMYSMLFMVVVH